MTPEWIDIAGANRTYQDEMAAALVAGLGLDDAVSACRNNGWDGVLGALIKRAGHPSGHNGPRSPATGGQ